MKFSPVMIVPKPAMKIPVVCEDDVRIEIDAAERGVERPARIDAAHQHRGDAENAAGHEQVPAQQIQFRKGDIARADHHRHEKITKRCWDRGDEKPPHHDDAVHGEQAVVRLGRDPARVRREQNEADHPRHDRTEEKERSNRKRIQNADALVIRREQPAPNRGAVVQIILRHCRNRQRCGGGGDVGNSGHRSVVVNAATLLEPGSASGRLSAGGRSESRRGNE